MADPTIDFNLTLPGGQGLPVPSWMDLNVTGSTNTNLIPLGNVGIFCASAAEYIYNFQNQNPPTNPNYNTLFVYNNADVYSSYDYAKLTANVPILANTLVAPETLKEVMSEVNWLLDNLTVSQKTFTETLITSYSATGVVGSSSVTSHYYTLNGSSIYTTGEIQDAIWNLLGDTYNNSNFLNIGTVTASHVTALVNAAATAHGNLVADSAYHNEVASSSSY